MKYKKYVTPAIETITMQTEGMIAGSPKNNVSFGILSGEGAVNAADVTSIEVEEPTSFELND